ncbi:MAG: 4-hydroxy-3-methylbut-2-enyl diphosphate reductase [Leptonema sp. (in: bacteria)]
MRKQFHIPEFYRSNIISTIKKIRYLRDKYRKDLTPTIIDLKKVIIKIARHFGFCYGVENAIEIAYRSIEENPNKKIYLISEMIHNPHVNNDLNNKGIQFLMKTDGTPLISFDSITKEDIVIIPAFGTTREVFNEIQNKKINKIYNTTCPFVEKVWNRSEQLGKKGYTIIIHGRYNHEETKATFSYAKLHSSSMVIQDKEEAQFLANFILERKTEEEFYDKFSNRISKNFNPKEDFKKIGVVNQTTMLATETIEISEILKNAIIQKYGKRNLEKHFADTKDTLCYATWENQSALIELLKSEGDIAIVVGGYNSSNTSHLVELCEEKLPTFYIKDEEEILSKEEIRHLDLKNNQIIKSNNWLPHKEPVTILLSAGASCPDALVDRVIQKISEIYGVEEELQQIILNLQNFKINENL